MPRTKDPVQSTELKRSVYETIRRYPDGISRRELQRQMGVGDPDLEENRSRVFRISETVTSLIREGFVVRAVENGMVYYYPQAQ